MTFRTGKNFLFLLLLTILPGLSCLTAAPAIPESVQSYVVVDTGKLLESTQFSRFEKIWENGVFFIDTLRNEAAKYHFELNDLQPYAVLVINWEKHDDSIVLIEFPEPVKERLLSTAAEMPDLFTVLNAPDARIMVKDNVASESEIDYVIAFLDGKQIIAGRKLILDTWLKEYCGIEVIDITRHMNFDLGNAIKYILRSGHKKEVDMTDRQKEIEDLRKAIWYINDYIMTLEGFANPQHNKSPESQD